MGDAMTALADALERALAKKNPAGRGGDSQKGTSMLETKNIEVAEPEINLTASGIGGAMLNERQAARWVENRLARMRREGAFAELDVLIYRELAVELLKLNRRNRRLREYHIAGLSAAQEDDRWINTGHPIIISSDGQMQDGQHRLSAIARTGATVPLDVRFGVDPAAFTVTDMGAKRTGADTLHVAGHHTENLLAAAVRLLVGISKGVKKVPEMPNDLTLRYVEEHPDLVDAVRIGGTAGGALKAQPSPLAAAAYLIIIGRGVEAAEAFFAELRAGAGPNFDNPRKPLPQLYGMIKDDGFSFAKNRDKDVVTGGVALAAGVVLAFNAHWSGKTIRSHSKLQVASGEPFPKVI